MDTGKKMAKLEQEKSEDRRIFDYFTSRVTGKVYYLDENGIPSEKVVDPSGGAIGGIFKLLYAILALIAATGIGSNHKWVAEFIRTLFT